jgi:ABC-type cobalamin/Fe3+-siderophores transport system ATPase subunit/ABC-type lipoprotein export system ATPase subunit
MNVVFKKLKVENRFDSSFENWIKNNKISFSDEGFIDIYAPNGVGKSSLARALNNDNKSEYEYEYEYNGKKYTEKTKESPVLVIDDFFFRNIATRDNEKLSDYILGSQIAKELELKEKIESSTKKVRDEMISYLKKEYNIKSKDSCLCYYINNDSLKKFINSISNVQDKGKNYTAENLIKLVSDFIMNDISKENNDKFNYIKTNIGGKESIIKDIIEFDTNNIKLIKGFSKLDINNDAINILNKHDGITKCIFEDTHILPINIKEQLENNKNLIIEQLEDNQKKIVNAIFELADNPFNIKEIFNNSFELGDSSKVNELILEMKEIILQIENEIIIKYKQLIKDVELEKDYSEYNKIIEKKIELSEEDEMLLKDIVENCINKKVNLTRDDNKNIIFTIEDNNFIGKSRQELPLSTGEQNFISLYFDLLSAKNSDKEIIIIDDPISSFDSIYKNKIIYSIIRVLANKKKVIILTHNINTIKLMYHQYKNCFNLYLLNNERDGENGFIKINKKEQRNDALQDMDFMLEIKNVISFFGSQVIFNDVKEKEQFLLSLISFMRSYSNLMVGDNNLYKELCKLMHGYENDKVDINEKFKDIFNVDLLLNKYEVNVEDILKIDIKSEIIDKGKYPILNRTLYHNLNYLKLRLLVENTLYNTDKTKMDWIKYPTLHNIIEKYLKNNVELKNKLLSKKTLLNEFNHFEYDMCLFMPSLDISDSKLKEENENIIEICEKIKNNGI